MDVNNKHSKIDFLSLKNIFKFFLGCFKDFHQSPKTPKALGKLKPKSSPDHGFSLQAGGGGSQRKNMEKQIRKKQGSFAICSAPLLA